MLSLKFVNDANCRLFDEAIGLYLIVGINISAIKGKILVITSLDHCIEKKRQIQKKQDNKAQKLRDN